MIRSFEQRHAAGGIALPCFGGDSSSATSTTNNTEVRDMRVVGGDSSQNVSANNSTVITTDHGAVKAGLDLGSKALDANTATINKSLTSVGDMFNGALDTVSANSTKSLSQVNQAFGDALSSVNAASERIAAAYQSGQAGDQTQLKYAGFVVVGLAAVALLPALLKR